MDLSNRVAVVTGAGSGIGRGLAVGLAQEGMKLVLAGYNLEPLEATGEIVSRDGAECLCVPTDVSQLSDVQRLAVKALERFGHVHLLCNNAGVGPFGTAQETSIEEWQGAVREVVEIEAGDVVSG
jgi:NAD(P)-dependent dehydrogenase (short-subunit alcohol dehydrogenase family)